MDKLIASLLTEFGYIKQSSTANTISASFINFEIRDCIVVQEYTIKELANFDNSPLTSNVMQLFEEASKTEEVFKNTSLIAPLKLKSFDSLQEVNNLILNVEENSFAFRKYVPVYTDEGVSALSGGQKNLKEQFDSILFDTSKFSEFEKGVSPDDYMTLMQLYIKLPFMKVSGVSDIVFNEFTSPYDSPENSKIVTAYEACAPILDNDERSFDEQASLILSEKSVINAIKPESNRQSEQ